MRRKWGEGNRAEMARGREKKAENEQLGKRRRRRERERVEAKDKRAIRFRDGWKQGWTMETGMRFAGTRSGSVDVMCCIIHFWPGQRATASTLFPATQPTIAIAREVLIGFDTTRSQPRTTSTSSVPCWSLISCN